jgi:hypothetical protein
MQGRPLGIGMPLFKFPFLPALGVRFERAHKSDIDT